jgi:predicted MFS family arabinose efflux permease
MVVAPLNTTVQMLAPDHLRAGVLAIYVMTFNFAYPVGALAQGALAEAVGARITIVVSGLIIFAAAATALARGSFAALDDDVGRIQRVPEIQQSPEIQQARSSE